MSKIIKLSIKPTESEEKIKTLKSYIAELINTLAETERNVASESYEVRMCCVKGYDGDTMECGNCEKHKLSYLQHIEDATRQRYKFMLE